MKWGSDTYTLLRSTVRQAAVIYNQGIKALCPRSQLQQQKTGLGPDQNSNMPELTSKLCVHRHKKKKEFLSSLDGSIILKGFTVQSTFSKNTIGETHPLSWGSWAAILTRPTRWALQWNIIMKVKEYQITNFFFF